MKRILADARAFGVQYLRSRIGAFFAFAFPVILILLFGSIFSQGGSSIVPLYVQDLDGTNLSQNFTAILNATGVLEVRVIPSGIAIEDFISQNSVNTALRIPAGFQNQVFLHLTDPTVRVNVTLYGDPTQSTYGIAAAAVSGAATQFNLGVAGATAIVWTEPKTIDPGLRYIDFFLPGMIGFTILTTPLFGMTSICAEYRTRKYFKFLATTTLTKGEWLAAKIIFYSLLMLASLLLMYVVSILVFRAQATLTPMALLFVVVGTFEFTSLGMILGLFVKDSETAATVANAIGFPMMFLAGTFFPLEAMPSFLQSIALVLPLTYVNEGLRATMVFGNDALALTYLLITLAVGIVLFIIPARALSWKSK